MPGIEPGPLGWNTRPQTTQLQEVRSKVQINYIFQKFMIDFFQYSFFGFPNIQEVQKKIIYRGIILILLVSSVKLFERVDLFPPN